MIFYNLHIQWSIILSAYTIGQSRANLNGHNLQKTALLNPRYCQEPAATIGISTPFRSLTVGTAAATAVRASTGNIATIAEMHNTKISDAVSTGCFS